MNVSSSSPSVTEGAQRPRRSDSTATLRSRWQNLPVPARGAEAPLMSPRTRVVVAAGTLAVLAVGLLATLAGWDAASGLLLALFLVLGVGTAVSLTAGPLTATSFTVYAGTAGLAATTAVGLAMAETGVWFPRVAFVLVGGAAVALLVRSLRGDVAILRRSAEVDLPLSAEGRTSLAVAVVALVGFATAVTDAAFRATQPQPGGLLTTVGPAWFVGVALIAVAFAAAIRARLSPAAAVLAAGSVVISSQAAMYGAPTVMAAARHIGLTVYIQVNGSLNATQDIYQAWPGLFAGSAWVMQAAGVTDPIVWATWWPVLVTPLTILSVRLLAGRFLSPSRAWIAAGIFALGDAVNSTYFAPQSYGFVLSMAVLALLVSPPAGETSRRRTLRLAFATCLILAVVVTHQISPFLLGFALVALVAFRLVRPWWAPLLALVPAIGWALLHRSLLARYIDLNAVGSLFGNIAPPEHPDAVAGVAPATRLVFYIPSAALVVLGLIALVTVIRRRDQLHLGLLSAAASPLGLALATNYGQEGIFRIVLFALPWLAILVASAVFTTRTVTKIVLSAVFVAMMAVNSYGQSGLDWARILRPGDAEVTQQFERVAADGATVLSLGTKNATPARITERYDHVGYTSRLRVGGFASETGTAYAPEDDLANVTDAFTSTPAPGGHYLFVSEAIGAYGDRYGLQRYDDFLRLRQAVAASPEWTLVYGSPTASLYKLTTEPVGNGG